MLLLKREYIFHKYQQFCIGFVGFTITTAHEGEVGCLRCPGALWMVNPGNPAISPHAQGKKTGTHHTEKVSGKREER